jgi:hypothetical protein
MGLAVTNSRQTRKPFFRWTDLYTIPGASQPTISQIKENRQTVKKLNGTQLKNKKLMSEKTKKTHLSVESRAMTSNKELERVLKATIG